MSNWIYRSQGNCTQFRGVRWVGRSVGRWIGRVKPVEMIGFFPLRFCTDKQTNIQYIHICSYKWQMLRNCKWKNTSSTSIDTRCIPFIVDVCLFVWCFLFWFFHTGFLFSLLLYFYHGMAFKWAARGSLTFSHHLISLSPSLTFAPSPLCTFPI